MMSSSSGRNNINIIRFPFTASQWQELEHQALVFKYMVSGMPVPPDLLFTITTSFDSSLSSKLLVHQPQHIGWNRCLEMGFERKIDPEPGRCRRTDGKKWRCSKEAYPDSKYCERHMHRGRNRSRKPVEINNIANSIKNSTPTSFDLSPHINYSSSTPTSIALSSSSSQDKHTNFNFLPANIAAHSPQPTKDSSIYEHGTKREISEEEHPIFSSGNSLSGHINKHNNIAAAAAAAAAYYNSCDDLHLMSKQNINQKDDNYYCACVQHDHDHDDIVPAKKVMHHFIDEWSPPKHQEYYSNSHQEYHHTTTHLSISNPNSLHDFFHDTNMKKT